MLQSVIACGHFVGSSGEFGGAVVGELTGLDHIKHIGLMLGVEQLQQSFLEVGHLVDGHIAEQAVYTAIDNGNLIFNSPGLVLGLNEKAFVLTATVDDAGGNGVDVATEFGERFELAELGLVDFQRTGYFFIDLIWAFPPTRETEIPTLMAGRMPRLNSAVSR